VKLFLREKKSFLGLKFASMQYNSNTVCGVALHGCSPWLHLSSITLIVFLKKIHFVYPKHTLKIDFFRQYASLKEIQTRVRLMG